MTVQDAEDLMCAVLRGEATSWPEASGPVLTETFLERSSYHGVQPLLHVRVRDRSDWPRHVKDALHQYALAQAIWELRHLNELRQITTSLAGNDIEPVLFKGTALAYTLYEDTVLRPRGDTDLIIRPHERGLVENVLAARGYQRRMGISGDIIGYQATYTLADSDSYPHKIDAHWRINNSQLLSQLFTYDEVRSHAVRLSGLYAPILAAGHTHALLLACMHRAVHKQSPYYVHGVAHYSGDRLIWLYDIHLLANTLSDDQWCGVLELARRKGLCSVCREGLERASLRFRTNVPQFVITDLSQPGKSERAGIYLSARALTRQWIDFCAVEGIRNKVRFLRELILPSEEYMLWKYSGSRSTFLPWLYVHRAFAGLCKRLSFSRQAS